MSPRDPFVAASADAPPASRAPLPPGGQPWDRALWLETADGLRLRGAVWNPGGQRGHVLLLHGRTEFLEKVCIPAAALADRGFAVASVDWRGQGLSERLLPEPLKGHVDDFESYHADLAALTAAPEVAALAGPRVVLAHSMGGTIAIGAMLRGRLSPAAAIFSAPMLRIAFPPFVNAVVAAAARLLEVLGHENRLPPVRRADQPYVFEGFDNNMLTRDPAVFQWFVEALRAEPRLGLGAAPTIGWLAASMRELDWIADDGRLGCPALGLIGGDEKVIDAAYVRRALRRLGADVAVIDGARHELLIEAEPMRGRAWARIDAFLAGAGL